MLMSSTMSYQFNNSDIQIQAWLEPQIASSITEKVVLTITPLEWLVVMYKIKWLFASNLILSVLKALQDLSSTCFTPGLQLQRQLNYTKCLVSYVVSNAQNRALRKRKMNSNPIYGHGHVIKGDKKDIANYRPNLPLNFGYKICTPNS